MKIIDIQKGRKKILVLTMSQGPVKKQVIQKSPEERRLRRIRFGHW